VKSIGPHRPRQARAHRNSFLDPESSYRRGFNHGAAFLYRALTEAGALDPRIGARVRAYLDAVYVWRANPRRTVRDQPPRLANFRSMRRLERGRA
jgi:hypothetical protein